MLRSWEKRSPEVAALFNPAFTSLLICTALSEFNKTDECEIFVTVHMLPLIRNPQTRVKNLLAVRGQLSLHDYQREMLPIKIGFAETG